MEETAPEYEPVFTSVYQYHGNSLASFTNTIDDLLLQLPILIKLKVQVPMSLFSIETVPVPLDVETYIGDKREYTQIILETKYIALTDNNYLPLTQVQMSLCSKIGYTYYCEYAHLLKKHTEHTCIKANQCKTIVTFDDTMESKILDASNILIISNLQKPWTIACKDVSGVFEIKYSTYHILNRLELWKCSLTAGNYISSQTDTNCGDMPEARDGYFTTYYALNKIILDVITLKFSIQIDNKTITQSTLLHDDIPGYNLPTLEFVLPSNSGIPSAKANYISRTFPPLFMIKIPEEEQIVKDLQEIESMQLVVQVIMVIACIIIAFTVLYYCCKKCRHTRTLFKYCFPFLPISRMLRMSCRTDLFVEVTNLMKGNTVWVHFTATGYFPTNIHLSRPILKGSVRIETHRCIFT